MVSLGPTWRLLDEKLKALEEEMKSCGTMSLGEHIEPAIGVMACWYCGTQIEPVDGRCPCCGGPNKPVKFEVQEVNVWYAPPMGRGKR